MIASCLSRHEMALMEEHIPGFNREWLTIQGAQTHKETLLEPAGPRQRIGLVSRLQSDPGASKRTRPRSSYVASR